MSGPRVFGLPHLSEDAVAAFADGVLSAAAASRARRHCAECAECADAVRGQRETAMLLRAAQAPALPSGLLDRLTGVPMSTPLPPPCGGLPTVLGADGIAMFVAHDVRRANEANSAGRAGGADSARRANEANSAGDADSAERPDGHPPAQAAQPRQAHRRGALPVTVLASAAAVVAAGTFGGHVSTLAAADRQAPSGAANAVGVLTGGQLPAARPASPLGGTASLLPVSRSSAATASTVPDQAGRTVRVSGGGVSVILAPLGRAIQQPSSQQPGTATQQPGSAAQQPSSLASAGSTQSPARHGTWSLTALAATMAGAPTATP
jgi:hypothetical protein